jgi:hypothetical protein
MPQLKVTPGDVYVPGVESGAPPMGSKSRDERISGVANAIQKYAQQPATAGSLGVALAEVRKFLPAASERGVRSFVTVFKEGDSDQLRCYVGRAVDAVILQEESQRKTRRTTSQVS